MHQTAAILSIGDELILGQSLDTNSAWLSDRLVAIGIVPREHATVHDDRAAIAASIRRLASIADVVIVTGGLGPTADDLTREGLADAMGEALVQDEAALADLKRWFEGRRRPMAERNVVQAMRPASARCLKNENGTAPGLAGTVRVEERDGSLALAARQERMVDVFCLPGPPREMMPMFEAAVVPSLRPRGTQVVVTRAVHTFGLGESDVAARLGEMMNREGWPAEGLPSGARLLVGTTVHAGIVTCRVRYEGPGDQLARSLPPSVEHAERAIRERLGDYVFGVDDETLASAVLSLLRARGLRLATVESCTGGLIGGAITAIPGSSDVYLGGWVTYANEMKVGEVGVPASIVSSGGPGAVSREAAEAMALGGLERSGADVCVSVTGIAGPGGGSAEKPVGTVWVAVAKRDDGVAARRFLFPGSRDMVRTLTVNTVLAMLRHSLQGVNGTELLREVR